MTSVMDRRITLEPVQVQSAAAARPAPRHPELVPDEPPATALQDRRAAHPTCPVLHPATRGELLDAEPLSADSPAHRAARVAPDVITNPTEWGRWRVSGDPAGVSLKATVAVTNPGNGGVTIPK